MITLHRWGGFMNGIADVTSGEGLYLEEGLLWKPSWKVQGKKAYKDFNFS